MHILGLKKIRTQRTDEQYYIGTCHKCNTSGTFNIDGYCNYCSSLFNNGISVSDDTYETFRLKHYWNEEVEFLPHISEDIIKDLTNQREPAPAYIPKNKTQIKNNNQKTNIMAKTIKTIGKTLVNGTCKTLGGAHLVVQTTADLIAVTEGVVRERWSKQDKYEVIQERKLKTVETQVKVCEKTIEVVEETKEKISKVKESTINKLNSIFKPANVEPKTNTQNG